MGSTEPISTRDRLRFDVLEILRDRIKRADPWFAGTLAEETRVFGDLDFDSVALVEFCVAVGKRLQKKVPFQKMVFRNGQFQDFSIGELLDFLESHSSD